MIHAYKKGVRKTGHRLKRHFAYVIRIDAKITHAMATKITQWCVENFGQFPREWLYDWKAGTMFVHTAENVALFKLRWSDELCH